jgi:hypothetical protein
VIRYVALTMGYVESGTITSLLLENQTGCEIKDAKTALQHIAAGLFQKYLYDHEYSLEPTNYPRECCKTLLKKKRTPKFCGECGARLIAEAIDREDYESWIYELTGKCADSYGEDIHGWWPWVSVADVVDTQPGELVVIHQNAEKLMVALLEPEMVHEKYMKTIKLWQEQNTFNVDKAIKGEDG